MADLEKTLYPLIEKFMRKTLGCFGVKVNTGLIDGRIDVVGLKDNPGDLDGSGEVIGIEVKRGNQAFLAAAGQASSYLIYADRSYLADVRKSGFNQKEKSIATKLGIGLISISDNAASRVTEVQSAPPNNPITWLRLDLILKLEHAVCTICDSFFQHRQIGTIGHSKDLLVESWGKPGFRGRAVEKEHGLQYWLFEADKRTHNRELAKTRRFVCPDCTAALFSRE